MSVYDPEVLAPTPDDNALALLRKILRIFYEAQQGTTPFKISGLDIPGAMDFKGGLSASGNPAPNYPVAANGDVYLVTAAGKVGGNSGKTVEVGDMVVAKADNAGGTEASVGTSWFVVQGNVAFTAAGLAVATAADAAAQRTALGAGIIGSTLFVLDDGGGDEVIPFINADNSVSLLQVADFRIAIGAADANAAITDLVLTDGNGISWSNTGGTTPEIVLTLGAITPTSVNGNVITAGSFTLTGAAGKTLTFSNTLTFTGTNGSSVAFGNGGTATFTSNNLSVFAATTSAQLLGVISDETGTGQLVFATSPQFTGPLGIGSVPQSGWPLVLKDAAPSFALLRSSDTLLGTNTTVLAICVATNDWATGTVANDAVFMAKAGGKFHLCTSTSGAQICRWSIAAAGDFLSYADASYDIGASGANRPKNIYLGGSVGVTTAGNLVCDTAGKGLQVKSGTGARAGNAVLVGGTVTVTNTTVTANTVVMLTRKTSGGTIGTAITYTLSAGASFTINSDSVIDTSTFSFLLLELN